MPLLTVILALVIIGALLALVLRLIPMEANIQRILVAVVVIAVILWLLSVTGILGAAKAVPMPRVG
jgi:hypothetical protein